jgi:hypothetical protein
MRVVDNHKSGTKNSEAEPMTEAKRRAKWYVVKGYHVLRHSYISALANKGIDQQIIVMNWSGTKPKRCPAVIGICTLRR